MNNKHTFSEVYPAWSSIQVLTIELNSLDCRLMCCKLDMGKAFPLTSVREFGDADTHNLANGSKPLVHCIFSHLEGQISDKDCCCYTRSYFCHNDFKIGHIMDQEQMCICYHINYAAAQKTCLTHSSGRKTKLKALMVNQDITSGLYSSLL